MALEAGDAIKGEGLAGAIANARKEGWGPDYKVEIEAKTINLEAAAIIDYLITNTEVEVTELPAGTPISPAGIGNIK